MEDFVQAVAKMRHEKAVAEHKLGRCGGHPDLEHYLTCARVENRWINGFVEWARHNEYSGDDEDRAWATYILGLENILGWLPIDSDFGVSELFLEFSKFWDRKYPDTFPPWQEATP